MITTKQPTDDMIEVAIVSMEEALRADGEVVPDGSTPFEREPMELGRSTPPRPVASDAGRWPTRTPAPAPIDPPPGT